MALEMADTQASARKVCVIGAGVSGLRAAGLLAKTGLDVTVLEARNRVGGRVHQSFRFDLPVDVGASWIHGTHSNPIVSLADQARATTFACGAVCSICDSNGNWLDRDIARELYEEVWDILETATEKSKNESASLPDSEKLMDFVRREVESRRPKTTQLDPSIYKSIVLQIMEMWGAFMGDDCERQSLKNLWLDAGLEGDNLFLASTYEGIISNLLDPVKKAANLRLCCEVTHIRYHTGVVNIEAADGFRGSFDSVIVTTPLGWLKRNEHCFSPPPAPAISKAIQSLGYGNLDRVFIQFPSAFWNDSLGANHTSESLKFPIESLFLSPKYAANTNPAGWRVEIISLSGLPAPFAQPVIMFFVYGQWGRHITGLVRGLKQDSGEYYRILNEHFRPYYSKLPNYDAAASECHLQAFLSTDWQNDRFAGYGAFCNLPVRSGDCGKHIDALREGMPGRCIWFPGEHASPPGGLGTVVGAYWSGEEAAKNVAHRHQISLGQ